MPLVCPRITKFNELPHLLGFWYLASPYSKYPNGIQAAFIEVCRVAGRFAEAGIAAYSPIAYTHPIARINDIDPHDHGVWLPFDAPMMAAAAGLVVVMMDSWESSYGVGVEIEFFETANKPVHYIRPRES